MGIRTILIKNPLLVYDDNKCQNNILLYNKVYSLLNNFIKDLKEDCVNYQEIESSNNGATLINNMENYLLEIYFTYKNIPVIIEYHFCDNIDSNKIINNIQITIKYQIDNITEYKVLLEKISILKEKLIKNKSKNYLLY